MRRGRGYLPADGSFPFTGLEVSAPPGMSRPSSAPVATNMIMVKGSAQRRKGYRLIGSALTGTPIQAINYKNSAGTEFLIVITTTKMYYWNGTAFVDITPKRDKIQIPYSSVTGTVSVGNTVTQQVTGAVGKVTADSGTVVTLDVYYGGFDVDATHQIQKDASNYYTPSTVAATTTANGGTASPWTGTEDDLVDFVTCTGTEGTWIIVTNGKDNPMYWDGSRSNFTPITNHSSFSFTDFVTCKTLAMFNNHLVMGNVTTTVQQAYLIAWSNVNSLVDFKNGTSGLALITDSQGGITKLKTLADRLAMYSEEGIGLISYVGEPSIFISEQLIGDTRLVSSRAVVDLKAFHLYMGRENCMVFDGTRQDRSVSDNIHLEYRERISVANKIKGFAFVDKPSNHVYFGTPISATQTDFYVLEYDPLDFAKMAWSLIQYTKRVTSMTFFAQDNDLFYNSPNIAGLFYSNFSRTYNSASASKSFPIKVLTFSDGTVGVADDTLSVDDTTTFTGTWESIDFTIPQEYLSEKGRWLQLEMEYRGTADVYVVDELGTAITIGLGLDSTSFKRQAFFFDTVSRSMRIRIQSTNPLELRWYRLWFRAVGQN